MSNDLNRPNSFSERDADAAAQWLARKDRGLSSAEQAAFAQWLAQDPARTGLIAHLSKTWAALDRLSLRKPLPARAPDPDLLAATPEKTGTRNVSWFLPTILAAAAAIAVGIFVSRQPNIPAPAPTSQVAVAPSSSAPGVIVHPAPRHRELEDGSVVELREGADITVRFTPAERHVELTRGEAHFIVAKNPARPFFVHVGALAVQAVGTAFSVARSSGEVSVLVTEGKVRVADTSGWAAPEGRELSRMVAGERAIVAIVPNQPASAQVEKLSAQQMDRALAWQGLRLEFLDLPLRQVVAEFNRYNTKKLVIGDAATGAIVIGGNFRADNLDSFLRLLDLGFGVSAIPRNQEIVLTKR